MNTLLHSWQAPVLVGSTGTRQHARPGPRAWLRAPVWLAMIAGLCMLGLLLAFGQVVAKGVEQAQSRHQATALHTDAVWRCNALRGASQRASCRVELDARQSAAVITVAQVTR